MASLFKESTKLLKLCQKGNLDRVKEFVSKIPDKKTLETLLHNRKGPFGYTPLHEATTKGHHAILDFLLQEAGDEHANCRANSGYTPLHLAASAGYTECVRVLLRHKADISATDEYGKTPRQTAELRSKGIIVRILLSAEIVKEAETNGDHLSELLRVHSDQLEPDCLNQAMTASVSNDNPYNVGKLIVKGADKIKEALKQSVDEKKPHARAMLLLNLAAMEGNCDLIRVLFSEAVSGDEACREYVDDAFPDVQKALLSGKVSTVVAIEIARRHGQSSAREELLLKTDVNEEEKYVHWHGLRLIALDINWLRRIPWVQTLRLARNALRSLPNEMGLHLKELVKLDLQHNELKQIPHCLLELPSLSELNLSHNQLQEIPDVPEWSASLTVLDLSYNCLVSLPLSVEAPSLRKLSIAYNQFHEVPKCICSFATLQELDLSGNSDIHSVPPEIDSLPHLVQLKPPTESK